MLQILCVMTVHVAVCGDLLLKRTDHLIRFMSHLGTGDPKDFICGESPDIFGIQHARIITYVPGSVVEVTVSSPAHILKCGQRFAIRTVRRELILYLFQLILDFGDLVKEIIYLLL